MDGSTGAAADEVAADQVAADQVATDRVADAELDRLVERAARWVVEKGLATPAVFLLELHKPVAPLGSMMLLGAMPFLGPFVGFGAVERLALFVEERANVERLIQRIEELDRDRSPASPAPSQPVSRQEGGAGARESGGSDQDGSDADGEESRA